MRSGPPLSWIAFAAGVTLAARAARADSLAILPFAEGDARARSATIAAAVAAKHAVAPDDALARATRVVADGHADTAAEYQALGRAAGVGWTVRGTSLARGEGYRVELEVCQVASGRVESLAREIDGAREVAEIGEMLSLLVRPEGLGAGKVPWEQGPPRVAKPAPAPPPPAPPPPPPDATPPAPPRPYAEGHPLFVAVTTSGLAAVARPSNAVGSSAALYLGGMVGYHLEAVAGLELAASVAGAAAGPTALAIDAGARYAVPIAPSARLFLVPAVGVGAFVLLGAQREARPLLRGGASLSLGLGERVTLEAGPELLGVPGGGGLLLAGGTARVGARF